MALHDLLGSPRDHPYTDSDPRNPKNYYKVVHDKRKADEAEQDRRMSEAYANGTLNHYQPATQSADGMGQLSAVEAGARERKIPGVISHNDALYFATVSGWTHTERWRPSKEDEAERLRRQGHGIATEAGAGDGAEVLAADRKGSVGQGAVGQSRERKKSVGERLKSFVFGAAGVTKE